MSKPPKKSQNSLSELFEMLRWNADAAHEVIKYLGNRWRQPQEKAKDLALARADQRPVSLLGDLATCNRIEDPNGLCVKIRITRHNMTNMVGIRTETAIRIMN